MKFDFDDILIKPAITSDISSRDDVNLLDENGMLPLMTAPMDTVVCAENIDAFQNNGIYPIVPRTATINHNRLALNIVSNNNFVALGLDQFIEVYITNKEPIKHKNYICLDIANGHMKKLADIIFKSKQIHGDNLILMVGSVANPNTYFNLSEIGADYIRIGIGSGAACITSQQTGIGYPLGSLIHDINIRKAYQDANFAKIVLDGGCKKYSDIIKALALGCFLPNTLVQTGSGFKQIKNINIGDIVITHLGNKRKVLNKFEYNNTKDIVSINNIYSTYDHKYYVLHKKFKDIVNNSNIHNYAEWREARILTEEYLLIENKISLLHRMQMFLKKYFLVILILYRMIKGELIEKKKNKHRY